MNKLTSIEKISILVGTLIAFILNVFLFNHVLRFPKTITTIIGIVVLIGGLIAYISAQKSRENEDYFLKYHILKETNLQRTILYSIWAFISATTGVCSLYYLYLSRVVLGLVFISFTFVLSLSLAFTLRKDMENTRKKTREK